MEATLIIYIPSHTPWTGTEKCSERLWKCPDVFVYGRVVFKNPGTFKANFPMIS